MRKVFIITEYQIDENGMMFIYPSLSYDSFDKAINYAINKFNGKKTYVTKESGSNESLIKCTEDEMKFFHVLEKDI
jgi:hypothetical protein